MAKKKATVTKTTKKPINLHQLAREHKVAEIKREQQAHPHRLNEKDGFGLTFQDWACLFHHDELVLLSAELQLQSKINNKSRTKKEKVGGTCLNNYSILSEACYNGDVCLMQHLLAIDGIDLHDTNEEWHTPLFLTMEGCRVDSDGAQRIYNWTEERQSMIECLLEHREGVNVHQHQEIALYTSIELGLVHVFNMLREGGGVDFHARNPTVNYSPLQLTCSAVGDVTCEDFSDPRSLEERRTEMLSICIDSCGCDVNYVGPFGRTAEYNLADNRNLLHVALRASFSYHSKVNMSAVRFILERAGSTGSTALLNMADSDERTPFFLLCFEYGDVYEHEAGAIDPSLMSCLLARGADPNIRNQYGYTALFWLCYYFAGRSADERRNLLQCVYWHGGDVTIADNYGFTPLDDLGYDHLNRMRNVEAHVGYTAADIQAFEATVAHLKTELQDWQRRCALWQRRRALVLVLAANDLLHPPPRAARVAVVADGTTNPAITTNSTSITAAAAATVPVADANIIVNNNGPHFITKSL